MIERTVGGARREGPFVPPYAYEHYVRGELAMEAGAWLDAVSELAMARSGADDDPLLCARHALALEHAGATREAEQAIADGFRLDAESEAVHLAASEIAHLRGDEAGALEHAEAAVRAAPRSRPAALALAEALERAGDSEEAGRVLAALPDAPAELWIEVALRAGDEERAVALMRRAHLDRSTRVRLAALLPPVLASEVLAPLSGSAPESDRERRLRIDVALATHRPTEAEGLLAVPAEHVDDELSDARAWLALGQAARAAEIAEAVRSARPSAEADVVLARAWLVLGRAGDAAALAARVPDGTSHTDEAHAVVEDALRAAGLPALAAELDAR